MKQKVIPLISIMIGIIAFWLSHQYLNGRLAEVEAEKQRLIAQQQRVEVIFAKKEIPANTMVRKEDLGVGTVLRGALSKEHILPEEAHRIFGKKALYAINRQEAVMWSYVDVPFRPSGGLAAMITTPELKGASMRAVSISAGGAAAVSGLVQPNDRVDILGTFNFPREDGSGEYETVTLTILQDVTVLATGQELAGDRFRQAPGRRGSARGYSMVTVEVMPREAELLVFAEQSRGTLTLSLRNPSDIEYERDLESVNFEHLQNKIEEYNRIRQELIREKPESMWKRKGQGRP